MKLKHTVFPQLMRRIFRYFLVIILILSLFIIGLGCFAFAGSSSTNHTLDNVFRIERLIICVQDMNESLSSYYFDQSPDYIILCRNRRDEALSIAHEMYEETEYDPRFRDIIAMLESYKDLSETALEHTRMSSTHIYAIAEVNRLQRLGNYICDEAHDRITDQVSIIRDKNAEISVWMKNAVIIFCVLFILLLFFCAAIAYQFSHQLAGPMLHLVKQFQRVSDGDLTIQEKETFVDQEMNELVRSFNQMVLQLGTSMEELRKKSALEKELYDEQMKNEQITHMLQLSEMKYLQMQINPHFLFNALNTISALATVENAPATEEMISNLSSLMRYTLSDLGQIVTLRSECDIIRSYLAIQKIRFASRLSFAINIREEDMFLRIPAMSLQPLVENAIIHGIEPKENGGHVEISLIHEGDYFVVTIRDTGCGMDSETLSALVLDEDLPHDCRRGIGISNVRHRLALLYGYDTMTIESTQGRGTAVHLHLRREISAPDLSAAQQLQSNSALPSSGIL